MFNSALSQEPVETLELPGLRLEVSAGAGFTEQTRMWLGKLEELWPHLLAVLREERILEDFNINPARKTLEVELTLSDNVMIRQLNREYRQKDQATDVLTFPLLSNNTDLPPWQYLPILPLGNIVISWEWAESAIQDDPAQDLTRYLLERFIHGMLHLLGCHHETMPQYERVVAIQNRVLDQTLGKGS